MVLMRLKGRPFRQGKTMGSYHLSWRHGLLAAAVGSLIASFLSACGVAERSAPVALSTDSTLVGAAPDSSLPLDVPSVYVYFLRDTRFTPVERISALINQFDVETSIDAALQDIMEPPSPRERRSGWTSPVIDLLPGTTGKRIPSQFANGVVTLDVASIAPALAVAQSSTVQLVITQLAYTALLGTPGVGGVRFTVGSDPIRIGDLGDSPVTVSDLSCLAVPCTLLPVALPVTESQDLDSDAGPVVSSPVASTPVASTPVASTLPPAGLRSRRAGGNPRP
jgi:hypothetical protein